MWLRNGCYELGIFKTTTFDTCTVSIGNLTVGGTGKTPHVAYLIALLAQHYPTATLSRGYGRRTKGFRIAQPTDTAATIGDEPLQLYEKFGTFVSVSVGEKRAKAVPRLLAQCPDTQVILLDDAYQHRAIGRHVNILLTDYNRLFYNDLVLPAGRLRECRSAARRADALVVSKCKTNLSQKKIEAIKKTLGRYLTADVPVFFSSIRYSTPLRFDEQPLGLNASWSVVLVSGLANAEPLEMYIKEHFVLYKHLRFGDHHAYTTADVDLIWETYQADRATNKVILCTEKDKVKLKPLWGQRPAALVGYLPIEIYFLADAHAFDKWILERIRQHYEPKNA